MNSFSILAFAALISFTVAQQPTYNATTRVFDCPVPNASYCYGASRTTNIIIQCYGVIGQAQVCDQNLISEFPVGISYSPCFQTSPDSGDAACTKNCVIYRAALNKKRTTSVLLPDCVQVVTPTSSTSSISSTSSTSTSITLIVPSTSISKTSLSSTSTISTTFTPTIISSTSSSSTSVTIITHSNASTSTTPTHFITPATYHPPTLITLTTAPTSSPSSIRNGTTIVTASKSINSTTKIPVGPTNTTTPRLVIFTGAAPDANRVCAGLAAMGMVFAMFL